MSDVFEEVDEDIRRDRMKKLWKTYGPWVIGVCAIIILAVGGAKGYESYQLSKSVEASNAYIAYVEALKSEADSAEALKTLEATGHKSYNFLGKMSQADAFASDKNIIEAVKVYDIIAFDNALPQNDRDIAAIKAVYLLIDSASFDDIKKRLEQLNVVENAFRFQARELIGLSAYKNGEYKEAQSIFSELSQNAQTPNSIRTRATNMLALLASKI